MTWTVTASMPPDMLAASDRRQNFRNVVFGRTRRALQKVVDRAAETVSYPPAKQGFRIEQTMGNSLEIDILNEAPTFWYTEYFRGKMPPFQEGTRLFDWAAERDLPPFPVARQLAAWGRMDAGKFRYIWESAQPELDEISERAVADFCARWGNTSA